MITGAEILRRARDWQVDPMIFDLDYVLGCFLSQWFRLPAAKQVLFKGETCIRKCYLPEPPLHRPGRRGCMRTRGAVL